MAEPHMACFSLYPSINNLKKTSVTLFFIIFVVRKETEVHPHQVGGRRLRLRQSFINFSDKLYLSQ